jgi:hypothetical protein
VAVSPSLRHAPGHQGEHILQRSLTAPSSVIGALHGASTNSMVSKRESTDAFFKTGTYFDHKSKKCIGALLLLAFLSVVCLRLLASNTNITPWS